MSKTNFEKVKVFHETYGSLIQNSPNFPDVETIKLRLMLIEEEYKELLDAIGDRNIIEVADALTDLLYVIYGTGISYGIDLDKCFEEVHNSNMSKLDIDGSVIKNEFGKIQKGPNYWKPDLFKVLMK